MDKPILTFDSITKDFPGVRALDNVSISFLETEIHGLVGENGAGKSTLIKILGGIYPYGTYVGKINLFSKEQKFYNAKDSEHSGIAIIYQELLLVPEMSIAENIFLGDEPTVSGIINEEEMIHKSEKYLKELGLMILPQTKIKDLGIGYQQMIVIAKALSKQAKVLVLDEPTSTLTEEESKRLLMLLVELKKRGVCIIYISHRLEEVLQIADRITVLRDGKNVETTDIKEVTKEKIVSLMVGRDIKEHFPRTTHCIEEEIFEIKNFNLYTRLSDKPIVQNINFKVKKGEILGIAGLVGAGRTELATGIFGVFGGIKKGEIILKGKKLKIFSSFDAIKYGLGFVSEDRKKYGLVLEKSVRENLTLSSLNDFVSGIFIDESKEVKRCDELVQRLNIKIANLDAQVKNLSGGNQQKVVLGKCLLKNPDVLILDEPTRGIDVGAKYEIYKLMNELVLKGKSILMISSELPELLAMSDRILVMHNGKIAGEFHHAVATQEKIMHCATGCVLQ